MPRRAAAVAVALALALAAVALVGALADGYAGALAGVAAVLVAADLLYAWRSNRWRAAVDRRQAAAVRSAVDDTAALARALDRVEAGQREVLDRVALLTTALAARASVDDARGA